jgi:hypothetical protein
MRSGWYAGLLLAIVSLVWAGGATARAGHHATASDCCYEISYDQYDYLYVKYTAHGSYATKQGAYLVHLAEHLRMLATAVTDPKYVHFLPVTEERAAFAHETESFETRQRAPNRSAPPGPWESAPDCYPTVAGAVMSEPENGNQVVGTYTRVVGRNRDLVRIDRSRKRTEVVFGPPIRDWKFVCSEYHREQRGGSGEGTYPLTSFTNLTPLSQSPKALPLANANGKVALCHLAGYQLVDGIGPGGDLSYQFKGSYSASVRIKKVPSGARKAEIRKLGKLRSQAPQWLPGMYTDFGTMGNDGPLDPAIPRSGCSK